MANNPHAGLGFNLESISLVQLNFQQWSSPPEPADAHGRPGAELTFGLNARRLNEERLRVLLQAELKSPSFSVLCEYVGGLLVGELPDAYKEKPEDAWKAIAGQIAPTALFPFIRETIHSTLARGDVDGKVLPIINFRRVFPMDEVDIENWDLSDEGAADDGTDGGRSDGENSPSAERPEEP